MYVYTRNSKFNQVPTNTRGYIKEIYNTCTLGLGNIHDTRDNRDILSNDNCIVRDFDLVIIIIA